MPDCEERVVIIYSASEETNDFDGSEDCVCPAQDAFFKFHEKIVRCIIGKGGQIVQNICSESGAQIRILKDKHLPACALSSDELLQVWRQWDL